MTAANTYFIITLGVFLCFYSIALLIPSYSRSTVSLAPFAMLAFLAALGCFAAAYFYAPPNLWWLL